MARALRSEQRNLHPAVAEMLKGQIPDNLQGELHAILTEPPQPYTPLPTFEIWMEGYCATGEYGLAHMVSEEVAEDFQQACEKWARRTGVTVEGSDPPRHWGCRLFPTHEQAKRNFG